MSVRKQGIYVNGRRVTVEASGRIVRVVDQVLRATFSSAELEIWSKGNLAKRTFYRSCGGLYETVEEEVR